MYYVLNCDQTLSFRRDMCEGISEGTGRRKAVPFEILENISLYCLISLANFCLLFNLSLIRSPFRYFYFVMVVLAKITTSDIITLSVAV